MPKVLQNPPYAHLELLYKRSVADSLVVEPAFRSWLITEAVCASSAFADESRLLHREMLNQRSKSCRQENNWAFSHYQEKCRCDGCSGRETDLLAIFEHRSSIRFAVHIEVKRPGDHFTGRRDQPSAYHKRALCWVNKAPASVLPHQLATTVLLFSEAQREEFAPHFEHFRSRITFEQIQNRFPNFFTRGTKQASSHG
jgi:hypothetical protein